MWTRMAISVLLILSLVCGAAGAESITGILVDSRTAQSFTDEAVTDEDLTVILEAGLAATSAINQQPWFFVAVSNPDIIAEISGGGASGGAPAGGDGASSGAPAGDGDGASSGASNGASSGAPAGGAKAGLGDSPVAIIIYMNPNTSFSDPSFDCGLACQNMFIAAKALGYGAKIVSSPTMQLNGDNHDALCEKLGVDKAYTAVAVLLIGREAEAVDGTSSASVRSAMEEKVSIVK